MQVLARLARELDSRSSGIDNSRDPLVSAQAAALHSCAAKLARSFVASVLHALVSRNQVIQISYPNGKGFLCTGQRKEVSPPLVRPRPSAASRAPQAPWTPSLPAMSLLCCSSLVPYRPLAKPTRTRRTILPSPRKRRVSANQNKRNWFARAAAIAAIARQTAWIPEFDNTG